MRSRARYFVVFAVLIAMVLWQASAWRGHGGGGLFANLQIGRAFDRDRTTSEVKAPPLTGSSSSYAFLDMLGAKPVSFDACRTIHYRVHVGGGPLNGVALVQDALAQLSVATGLQFQYDGVTDSVITASTHQRGDSPVWIGWAEDAETDIYAKTQREAIGVGGPTTLVDADGQKKYVTGFVILDPNADVRPGFGAGLTEGNVLLHELGHLVGLAHVSDPTQQMNVELTPMSPAGFGPGDLVGLWQLGASKGCS